MNTYKAYYGNATCDVEAETSLAARDRAIATFQKDNPRRRIKPFEVSVILGRKGGEDVVHTPTT